jgi:hypothetical protein
LFHTIVSVVSLLVFNNLLFVDTMLEDDDDSGDDAGLLSDQLGLATRRQDAAAAGGAPAFEHMGKAAETVVSADVIAMRERFVKMRQLKRQERENLDLERTQREHDEEWKRKMSIKYHDLQPKSSDYRTVKSGSSSAIHDVVSGLTAVYEDYAVFVDKVALKRRVRAMDDVGYASYGARPGLVQRATEATAVGFDSYEDAVSVLAEIFRAAGNPRLAQQAEQLLAPARNVAMMAATAPRRLRFLLQRQLQDFGSFRSQKRFDDAVMATALSQLLSWMYLAAVTGTGCKSYCPRLGRLSHVALDLLLEGSDDFQALNVGPSWEQLHATLNQYRAVPTVASGDAPSGPPPYVNELGLEHALKYWTHDRLLNALCRDSSPNPPPVCVLDLISRLSQILLDENLEQLHSRAVDGIRALVLHLGSHAELVSFASSEDAAAEAIFHDLSSAAGPTPRTAKYPDDKDASLAHCYLLGALLRMRTTVHGNVGNNETTTTVSAMLRRFLLACAQQALSRLGVPPPTPDDTYDGAGGEEVPVTSPKPTAAHSPATPATPSSNSSSPTEVASMIRPSGVGLEAWQALTLSVHALESFFRDKEKGAKCLAALDCAFSVFRAGISWLPTSIEACTERATRMAVEVNSAPSASDPSPTAIVREFGSREQAGALYRLLERYSSGLIVVGKFLGSMTRNEYFRHADLHLQVMNMYIEQIALPRCARQAGISFKPSALKQQVVTRYFVHEYPVAGR